MSRDASLPSRRLLAVLFVITVALWAGFRALRTLTTWLELGGTKHGMTGSLILAWVPLGFAFAWAQLHERRDRMRLLAPPCALLWLLFYPNAPYLSTEFQHLRTVAEPIYWQAMVLLMGSALLGLVTGFFSLEVFRSSCGRRWGAPAGWLLVAVVAGLSGIGIYFGRILRFNSWWVFSRLDRMQDQLETWIYSVPEHPHSLWFAAGFAALIAVSHWLFYELRRQERPTCEAVTK
jgi:uncharacterized membrane protein